MKKILIVLLLFTLFPVKGYAEELDLTPKAKSAILIEAVSGEIIYQKNAHTRVAPASMTKMLSMILILEEIEKGTLTWDEKVTTSREASGMGGSQIWLEIGEVMTVKELFTGVVVASANDAVVALAERVAGTEEAFVNRMNKRIQEMGLKNTHFKNSSGLDEKDHYTSAYDVAMIARELLKHKQVLEFSSIYEAYLRKGTDREVWLVNTNKLLKLYQGVDGLKTGWTDAAGSCLTATALKNNMRLIAVVMGEPDTTFRNEETMRMLDYGYNHYEVQSLITKNSKLNDIEIEMAKNKYVSIEPIEEAVILIKRGEAKKENIIYEIKLDKKKAPIKRGEIIGQIIIKENNKVIKKINITVKEDVEKSNIFSLYFRHLKDIFTGDLIF